MESLELTLLPERVAVCRFQSGSPLPHGLSVARGFFSVTRTGKETSVICGQEFVPEGAQCELNFRIFELQGPLDFSLTGVLSSLLNPLADAGVAVFTISTYDTDYILIREECLELAIGVLNEVASVKITVSEDF